LESLGESIGNLAEQNQCSGQARVRLTVFRENAPGNGAGYVVECTELPGRPGNFEGAGLQLGLFEKGRKNADMYSNLKTCGALLYAEAARAAVEGGFDDCMVLNTGGQIADTSIANLFIVKDNRILTPALAEGCVAGTLRRHLLESLAGGEYEIAETSIGLADLEAADECFLTNAIRGIRWVAGFRTHTYGNRIARELHRRFFPGKVD
jgi:branched-chain amino acid aminotransferase